MHIRVPRHCEAQWLRARERLETQLRETGVDPKQGDVTAAAFALLDAATGGPGVVYGEGSPVYEAPPRETKADTKADAIDRHLALMREGLDIVARAERHLRQMAPDMFGEPETEAD